MLCYSFMSIKGAGQLINVGSKRWGCAAHPCGTNWKGVLLRRLGRGWQCKHRLPGYINIWL